MALLGTHRRTLLEWRIANGSLWLDCVLGWVVYPLCLMMETSPVGFGSVMGLTMTSLARSARSLSHELGGAHLQPFWRRASCGSGEHSIDETAFWGYFFSHCGIGQCCHCVIYAHFSSRKAAKLRLANCYMHRPTVSILTTPHMLRHFANSNGQLSDLQEMYGVKMLVSLSTGSLWRGRSNNHQIYGLELGAFFRVGSELACRLL